MFLSHRTALLWSVLHFPPEVAPLAYALLSLMVITGSGGTFVVVEKTQLYITACSAPAVARGRRCIWGPAELLHASAGAAAVILAGARCPRQAVAVLPGFQGCVIAPRG